MFAASAITWIEIPSKNLDRATRFYEDVLDVKLKPDAMGPTMKFSVFPADKGQPTDCVMQADGCRPSAESTAVYLNLREDLTTLLAKIEKAEEQMLLAKTMRPSLAKPPIA